MIQKLFIATCMLLVSVCAYAQRTITGKISDANGNIQIASVREKGTDNVVQTDENGNFSINVSSANASLLVTAVGYKDLEVPLEGRQAFDLSLQEDTEQLEELVVTALGFSVDKKTLGSTYAEINADDARQSGEISVINSLAGKASGLKIARVNGDPGAGSSIQIRGANTISGNTQPLIVVDGIVYSNENANGLGNVATDGVSQQSRLNDINPDDIETVNVIKGASAAAVWGSQAANGVIVIKTKKGTNKNKIDVSYAATYSVDEIASRHPLQTTYGQGSGGKWGQNNSRSWGDKISARSGAADVFNTSGQYFETANGTKYYPITAKNSQETFVDRNFNEVFRTGQSWNHSLSVSGAGKSGDFYFSLAKLDNDGIIKNSSYQRINATLNGTYKLTRWLSIRGKVNYAKINSNRIQQSSNVNGLYLGLLRNAPDVSIADYIGTYYNSSGTPNLLRQRSYRNTYGSKTNSGYNNPLWTVNEQENLNTVDRYVINLEATIKPTKWLTVIARGGVDNYLDVRTTFFPMFSSSDEGSGQYAVENRDLNNFSFDVITRSNVNLKGKSSLNVLLGYGHTNKQRYSVYTFAKDFLYNTRIKDFETLATDDNTSVENSKSFFRSDRLFTILAFSYSSLFINLSGAYETFSSTSVGVFYPAVDIAWNFSTLKALQGSFLSEGKLRASFGQVGVSPQRHRFNTTYESADYNDYSDPLSITYYGGGYRLNDDAGNPSLRPEIKTEFEVGVGLKFFKNRISLGVTYYTNQIDDILLDVALSPSSGFNNQYRNAGKLENSGIEIDFDVALLRGKDYGISLYGNFNNNKSKVLDLAGTTVVNLVGGSISSVAAVGHPMGVLWGSRIKRDKNGKPILDDNGFLQQDPQQGVIGDPNPDWRGGLGLRANFKGIYVNILFEISQGNDYAERTRFILGNFGTHADVGNEVTLTTNLKDVNGKEYKAGETVRGNIADFGAGPVLLNQAWYTGRGGGFGSSPINELAINDGSFVRLREISIGYTLNSAKFRQKTKLSAIQLSITARNIALWTKLVGVDPEINQSGVANGFGIDYFTNPTTHSFVFSIKVSY